MGNIYSKIFNRYSKLGGQIGSDSNYDIYRPDYTAANQTGTLIASNKSARIDTRAQQWAEPSMQGGMYFDIFMDRTLVQEGDILVPTGLSPTSSTRIEAITIAQITGLKPCVGIFTDCLGRITQDVNTTTYSNVRWMWGSPGQPKNVNTSNVNADLFPFERRKVIMYRREGRGLPTPIVEDMNLVETVDGLDKWWRIVDLLSVGSFSMLQVERNSM